jgi:hypothetical protein
MFANRAWYDVYAGKIVQFNARAGTGTLTAVDVSGGAWTLSAPAMKQVSNFIFPPHNAVLLLANFTDGTTGLPLFVGTGGKIGGVASAARVLVEPQRASPPTDGSQVGVNILIDGLYVGLPTDTGGPLVLSTTRLDYPWVLAFGTSAFTLLLPQTATGGLGVQSIVLSASGAIASKSTRLPPSVFECVNNSAVSNATVSGTGTNASLALFTPATPVPSGIPGMFASSMVRVSMSDVAAWSGGMGPLPLSSTQPAPGDAFELLATQPVSSSVALVNVDGQGALTLAQLGAPLNLPLVPFVVSSASQSAQTRTPAAMLTWATALGTMPYKSNPSWEPGVIAGVAIGAAALVGIVIALAVVFSRRARKQKQQRTSL